MGKETPTWLGLALTLAGMLIAGAVGAFSSFVTTRELDNLKASNEHRFVTLESGYKEILSSQSEIKGMLLMLQDRSSADRVPAGRKGK